MFALANTFIHHPDVAMILLLSRFIFLSLQDMTKLLKFDEKCTSLLQLLMLKPTLIGHEMLKSKYAWHTILKIKF